MSAIGTELQPDDICASVGDWRYTPPIADAAESRRLTLSRLGEARRALLL